MKYLILLIMLTLSHVSEVRAEGADDLSSVELLMNQVQSSAAVSAAEKQALRQEHDALLQQLKSLQQARKETLANLVSVQRSFKEEFEQLGSDIARLNANRDALESQRPSPTADAAVHARFNLQVDEWNARKANMDNRRDELVNHSTRAQKEALAAFEEVSGEGQAWFTGPEITEFKKKAQSLSTRRLKFFNGQAERDLQNAARNGKISTSGLSIPGAVNVGGQVFDGNISRPPLTLDP